MMKPVGLIHQRLDRGVRQPVSLGLTSIAAAMLTGMLTYGCGQGASNPGQSKAPAIAVTQIVEHPSLNAVRDGLKAELTQAGYQPDQTLKWQWESAQGNPSLAAQIAKKFAGDNPDVVVAISTPSAQAMAAAAPKLPLVFSTVTDPLAAKLVNNLEKPGGLITGVSDLTPVDKHLQLITQITPQVKRIGVLYNAGESNSVSLVKLLKAAATNQKLEVVEATVANTSEVANAAKSLVGRTDAIYIPTDNTAVSALESVIQVGVQNKLPVYAGDNDSVERGAIASIGFDYYDVGRQTGKMVVRVLRGEKPGEIAVETPTKLNLTINVKSAQQMGVTVPEKVLSQAVKVIK
ncbi:ABC transporter substrate-binding protein [Alkalinema pantanalense CENA528]|uniref:ABC transporter substrate-binding protein n=1 Tax=Alkalinema pantanalense TaxID=1620705 RepID=UPI003D6FFC88